MRPGLVRLAIAAALLAGCVESRHPLAEDPAAVADPRLDGLWAAANPAEGAPYQQETYLIRRLGGPLLEVTKLGGHLAVVGPIGQVGPWSVVSLRRSPDETRSSRTPFDWQLFRYELEGEDTLRIWFPDTEFVAAAVRRGELKGRVTTGETSVRLTASTAALGAWFGAADPGVWKSAGFLTRIGATEQRRQRLRSMPARE